MSTRVQKGSTTFKPVAKPRARPGSRAPSVSAADNRSSPGLPRDVAIPPVSGSMPPPPAIPTRLAVASGVVERSEIFASTTDVPHSSDVLPATASFHQLIRPPDQPPVRLIAQPVATNSTPHPVKPPGTLLVDGQSRSSPIVISNQPPTPISAPRPANVSVVSTGNPLHHVSPHTEGAIPHPDVTNQAIHFDPPIISRHQVELGPPSGSGISNNSRISLNTDTTVEVAGRRRSGRTKQTAIPGESNATIGEDQEGGPARQKKTRSTRSKKLQIANGNETQDTAGGPVITGKKRARRNAVQDFVSDEEGSPSNPEKRRRRISRGPRKPRKARVPSMPPFDTDAGPGEELDPTTITMADLCSDTGQGRISTKATQIQTNHIAWKVSNKEKRARMKMLMEAKKYGRDEEEHATTQPTLNPDAAVEAGEASSTSIPVAPAPSPSAALRSTLAPAGAVASGSHIQDETGHGFDYSQTMSSSRFNVQVRIGPNGETIIDEDSLFVDRNDEEDTENYTHVEESDTTKFVNSATYGKKFRGSRWSAEETELFYDALSQFGENYELISYVLPGRDRKSCKNKFKAEDKKNSNRITYCLNNRAPYDIQTLSRMTGKDFSGPTPEIRAPSPLTLANPGPSENVAEGDEGPMDARKQSSTPGLVNGEEVLGDAAEFEDDP